MNVSEAKTVQRNGVELKKGASKTSSMICIQLQHLICIQNCPKNIPFSMNSAQHGTEPNPF